MGKGNRRLLVWLLTIFVLGAVGCDAIEGADADQAIRSLAEVESRESVISLEWELVKDTENVPDQKTEAIIDAFGDGALRLTEVKQQDRRTMSAKGELTFKDVSIPFAMYVNGQELVLEVEGAKKPFRIHLRTALNDMYDTPLAGMGLGDLLLNDSGQSLADAVVGYAAGHLPNPEKTTVTRVSEKLGGEEKELTKITYELQGGELKSLLLAAVNDIMQDESGLKALIGGLYDALKPQLEQKLKETPDFFLQLALQSKDLAVNYLYGQISMKLSDWFGEASESAADWAHHITLSWLLDGVDIVGVDAAIAAPADAKQHKGIKSIMISFSDRWWNVNGEVKAEVYTGETEDLSAEVKPRERLRNIETDSALYDILKNTLRVTTQTFRMYMGENAQIRDGVSPYIKPPGTTMVPVRYVSEQLDAKVEWNNSDSSITITDEAEGISIVMKIGSKTAFVNGEARQLNEAPELVFDSTFVPIAFITNALNGEAIWDPVKRTVTITKEF